MTSFRFDHCNGIATVPPDILAGIEEAISKVALHPGLKKASPIRDAILDSLVKDGWSGEVPISGRNSQISITSIKKKVGLFLQTGNMARMYADLLKIQKLYIDGAITSAVGILPSGNAAGALGQNIASADRLVRELEIFRKVIFAPMVIIAFE